MVFDEYAEYYDLLYKDKDYVAEANYIDGILQKYANGCQKILELGCGTGKHAELLSYKGYEITGIDMSEDMLKKAYIRAENNNSLSFLHSNIQEFSLGRKYDAVTAWFHVMSYQNTYEEFLKVLMNAYDHLKNGGVFVFDCWYGPAVLLQVPERRIKRLENERSRVTRIAEPILRENDNVVEVHYDMFIENKSTLGGDCAIKEIHEQHNMRYFFVDEVRLLVEKAGFLFIEAFEFMTDKPLGRDTWGACFVVRK